MRTLRYTAEAAIEAEAAAALVAWAGVGKKKAKKTSGPNPTKARDELREMLTAGDFAGASPTHLVALYEWCHEQVYGMRPAELTRAAWRSATCAAAKLAKDEFGGSVDGMVGFIRWTWAREKAREHARRTGRNPSIGRVGWRLQFVTRHLVTDYRIDAARRGTL